MAEDTGKSLLQRLAEALAQADLGLPSWLGWVLLAVFLGLIGYFLSRLISVGPSQKGPRKRVGATIFELTEGKADTWEQALQGAGAALRAGDLRQALWLTHRLLLLRLDGQDAICFERSKTNNAYLRECPLEHPSRSLLHRLTEQYENVVYGHKDVPLEGVVELLEEVSRL